jgi:hypothetical protein
VEGILYIKIYKSAFATDAGLQGNIFFDPMILTDDHDYFIGLAGPQANVTLYNTFLTALTTGISVFGHAEAP